jgi:hypothetical protein
MPAPVAHILPLTTIRRERLLPVPGRIIVRLEQKVNPLDVVAEANFGGEHLLIDVARMFDLRADVAQALIQVRVGDTISKGDVIARRKGFSAQSVNAPADGRVILVGAGQVLMEVGEATFELRAGIPGVVTRQITDRGVEIQFSGALIQGVWGNGRLDIGLLLPMLSSPEEPLVAKQLDVSLRGSVLLAGSCSDPAALKTAGDLPVRGLILGSMSSALVSQAMQVQYPIIVVDGFGQRPLNDVAFRLLSTNAKRETTLNAEVSDRQAGTRPEILITLPVTQDPPLPREVVTFASEQTVRLTREPHKVGILVGLRSGLTTMPSGLRVAAGDVRLESGELVLIPLANLEVLG